MLPIVPIHRGSLPVRRPDRMVAARPVAPVPATTDAVWEERPGALPRPALAPGVVAAAEADLLTPAPPPPRRDPRIVAYHADPGPHRGTLLDIRL